MSVVSVAFVKQWANIKNAEQDGVIGTLVEAVSAAAESYIEGGILSADYSQQFHGTGTATLVLPNRPVTAVSSVTVEGWSALPAYSSLSPGTRSFKFDDFSIRAMNDVWPRGILNVSVSYTAGYATCPADLQQALVEWTLQRLREPQRHDVTSMNVGGGSVTFRSGKMPNFVESVLKKYKRSFPA